MCLPKMRANDCFLNLRFSVYDLLEYRSVRGCPRDCESQIRIAFHQSGKVAAKNIVCGYELHIISPARSLGGGIVGVGVLVRPILERFGGVVALRIQVAVD